MTYDHLHGYEMFKLLEESGEWYIEFDGNSLYIDGDDDLIEEIKKKYPYLQSSLTSDKMEILKKDLYTLKILKSPRLDILTYHMEPADLYESTKLQLSEHGSFMTIPDPEEMLKLYPSERLPDTTERIKKREELLQSPVYDLYQQIRDYPWSIGLDAKGADFAIYSDHDIDFPEFIKIDKRLGGDGYTEYVLSTRDPYKISILSDLVLLDIDEDNRNLQFNADYLSSR